MSWFVKKLPDTRLDQDDASLPSTTHAQRASEPPQNIHKQLVDAEWAHMAHRKSVQKSSMVQPPRGPAHGDTWIDGTEFDNCHAAIVWIMNGV
jgi:hypothetical protein